MKKNTWALLIGLVLIGTIAFIMMKEKNVFSGINDFNNFSIKDTASITSIFIADKTGGQVTLEKHKDGSWWVKDKFEARPDAIQLLLKTFKQLEIYSTVSDDSYETVLKNLASLGKKVEVYKNYEKKPIKTYYIGSATFNRMGTYTLLEIDGEVSDVPYVTHVTTENGSIASRFFIENDLWRERVIFKYNPKALRSVEVRHFNDTVGSFQVTHLGEGKFEIKNYETGEVFPLSSGQGIGYFNNFAGGFYEYIDHDTPKNTMDSIYLSPPRTILTIVDTNGESLVLKSFFMPVKEGATDYAGNPVNYNPERMYVKSSKSDLNMVVQNYTYDEITPGFEDFELSTNVEK